MSFGFALPFTTPPNAIAFATGAIGCAHMLRSRWLVDVVMAWLATVAMLLASGLAWPLVV